MTPAVTGFFDEATFTASYVVADPETGRCAIIDPVLDYDAASGRTRTDSADELIAHIREQQLTVDWILETHVHADHLTAAPYLKRQLGGQIAIGIEVSAVQSVFGQVFNVEATFEPDGSQFDRLLNDGDTLDVGSLTLTVMHTPGHTPACVSYLVGDSVFVGDTMFMPDYGSARTDFPGGDAATLYRSIQKILALPATTRLFLCHDYKAPGRDIYCHETTVGDQKINNVHLHEGVSEADFVKFRTERDAGLAMPMLLLPAVQVNMRAGELPPAEDNGTHYLKIPIDAL